MADELSLSSPFADTPRGKLAAERVSDVEPVTFYLPEGGEYEATDPAEINRLRLGRTAFESREVAADPVAAADTRFHPGEHNVGDVLTYVAEHPVERERVLAEEQAGQNRPTLVAKLESSED